MDEAWDSGLQNPHKIRAALVAACYPSAWEAENGGLWSKLARLVRSRELHLQQEILPQ